MSRNLKPLFVTFTIIISVVVCICIGVTWLMLSPAPGMLRKAASTTYIAPDKLRADLDFLLNHIKSTDPQPYRNCSQRDIDALSLDIKNKLTNPIMPVPFYRILKPLVSAFNDPHLTMIYPDFYAEKLHKDNSKLFPYQVVIDKNELFIKKNYVNNSTAQNGWQILSINHIPTEEILKKLSGFCSGPTEQYKARMIEASFQIYFWRAYGFEGLYTIEPRRHTIFSTTGIPVNQLDSMQEPKKAFEFRVVSINHKPIALITIASLQIENRAAFDAFLHSTFAEIKTSQINHLIIDIRNNLGGSTLLARDCFDYITDKPYSISCGETTFKQGKLNHEPDTSLTRPGEPADKFKGGVYLMYNALTNSSAYMMAVTFSYYKLGFAVGDTGCFNKQMSGEVSSFILPNSGLQVYCPSSSFILPNHQSPNENFIPEYLYKETRAERLANGDAQLDYCLSLINKEK